MSVVIAVSDGKTIEAGADSAGGSQDEIYEIMEEKIFVRGAYLIGYCGSLRIGQILRYEVELPDPPAEEDLAAFLVKEVMPEIRRAVETAGAAGKDQVLPGKTMILLGCRGGLWCIGPELFVSQAKPYAVIGSGRHHAYGALHALLAAGMKIGRRLIELGLQAAAAYTPSVRPPFRFVALGSEPGSPAASSAVAVEECPETRDSGE